MNLRARLSSRDLRALGWGAVVLVPALGWSFARPYRRARAELEARVAEQRGLLSRELSVLSGARGLTHELESAGSRVEDKRSLVLAGSDPLAATAALVGLVGEAARRNSVLFESIESRPPEPVGQGVVAVRIEVRGRGDFEGLLRWLRALEAGPRLLRVDALSVARIGSSPEAAPDSLDAETLALGASIRGYVLGVR